jgi:hypothetical protein
LLIGRRRRGDDIPDRDDTVASLTHTLIDLKRRGYDIRLGFDSPIREPRAESVPLRPGVAGLNWVHRTAAILKEASASKRRGRARSSASRRSDYTNAHAGGRWFQPAIAR